MRLLRLATVALVSIVAPAANAAETTDACMRMDLELTWLIEEHGEKQDVSASILAQAAFHRQDARGECKAGREEAALMIYEDASRSIVSPTRAISTAHHNLSSD